MPSDFFTLSPGLPMTLWSMASIFLNTAEGGRFRWGNLYGNTAILFCFAISSSLEKSLGQWHKREAAMCGFTGGALTVALPLMKIVQWRRLIPPYASSIIGSAYMVYYGNMYYQEVYAIEDAGED